MGSRKMRSNIMLLLTAVVWGAGFVAQKAGAVLEPFTYNALRMLLGGLVLLPVIWVREKKNPPPAERSTRSSIAGGIACGAVLCVASNLQQFGIYFQTDAGKAGFITSLYIVFVPVLGLFLGRKARPAVWGCVALGAFGFYLLTMAGSTEGFRLQKGDFFLLLCSFAFACHIMAVDHFSPHADGFKLSCAQFLTAGALSAVLMLGFETPDLTDIKSCWGAILYSGAISSGMGYTLQVLGQKGADPAAATLIMSLESVFSVLFGALLMKEQMAGVEWIGCAVIFTAVVLSQLLPEKK